MATIRIHAAGNTYNPCLIILAEKGYALSAEENGESMIWTADKGENSFSAVTPPELLGIVVLGETFGADWNRQQPDLIGKITDEMPC